MGLPKETVLLVLPRFLIRLEPFPLTTVPKEFVVAGGVMGLSYMALREGSEVGVCRPLALSSLENWQP